MKPGLVGREHHLVEHVVGLEPEGAAMKPGLVGREHRTWLVGEEATAAKMPQ